MHDKPKLSAVPPPSNAKIPERIREGVTPKAVDHIFVEFKGNPTLDLYGAAGWTFAGLLATPVPSRLQGVQPQMRTLVVFTRERAISIEAWNAAEKAVNDFEASSRSETIQSQ